MRLSEPLVRELTLAAKFAAACMIGFVADAVAFRAGLDLGLDSPLARVIALGLALQVSFALSRWLVFRVAARGPIVREWWRYMVANGFGSFCNLAMFASLVTVKWPLLSRLPVAFVASSTAAFIINYAGTRLFVYGKGLAATRDRAVTGGALPGGDALINPSSERADP